MRTRKFLTALSLVLGASCIAADRVPTTQTTADYWSSSLNKVILASTSNHTLDSIQLTSTRAGGSAKSLEDRTEKGHSNLRLMLIGVLLIGAVALRGRKNLP